MAMIMTLDDLMHALSLSADEVNALIAARKLPGHSVGGLWRVDPIEWEEFINPENEDDEDDPGPVY